MKNVVLSLIATIFLSVALQVATKPVAYAAGYDELLEYCLDFETLTPELQNSMVSLIRGNSYSDKKPPYLKLSIGDTTLVRFFGDKDIRNKTCPEVITKAIEKREDGAYVTLGSGFRQNAGVDLEILKFLPPIKYLKVDCYRGYSKSGLKPLAMHPEIKTLVIVTIYTKKCAPADYTVIGNLSELETLKIYRAGITEVSWIQRLNKLVELDLTGNQLRNVDDLENSVQLQRLNLSENPLENISGLMSLINLSQLDISEAKGLPQIQVVRYMVNLTSLSASDSEIQSLVGVEDLHWLAYANFTGNRITDVSPLANLKNLTGLDLRNNQISDGTPLGNLTQLLGLSMDGNRIRNFDFFRKIFAAGNIIHYDTRGNPGVFYPENCPGHPRCPRQVENITIKDGSPSAPITESGAGKVE